MAEAKKKKLKPNLKQKTNPVSSPDKKPGLPPPAPNKNTGEFWRQILFIILLGLMVLSYLKPTMQDSVKPKREV